MCLAIPSKIVKLEEGGMATVDIMGVTRTISIDLVPEATGDDWVLVHAGFAIQIIDEQFANETLELLKTVPFFDEEPLLAGGE